MSKAINSCFRSHKENSPLSTFIAFTKEASDFWFDIFCFMWQFIPADTFNFPLLGHLSWRNECRRKLFLTSRLRHWSVSKASNDDCKDRSGQLYVCRYRLKYRSLNAPSFLHHLSSLSGICFYFVFFVFTYFFVCLASLFGSAARKKLSEQKSCVIFSHFCPLWFHDWQSLLCLKMFSFLAKKSSF